MAFTQPQNSFERLELRNELQQRAESGVIPMHRDTPGRKRVLTTHFRSQTGERTENKEFIFCQEAHFFVHQKMVKFANKKPLS